MTEESGNTGGVARRTLLRLGAAGGAAAAVAAAQTWAGPLLAQTGLHSPDGAFAATSTALSDGLFYIEAFPTSPLVLTPFSDPLLLPKALAPSRGPWSAPGRIRQGRGRASKTSAIPLSCGRPSDAK